MNTPTMTRLHLEVLALITAPMNDVLTPGDLNAFAEISALVSALVAGHAVVVDRKAWEQVRDEALAWTETPTEKK